MMKLMMIWANRVTTFFLFAAFIAMLMIAVSSRAGGGEPVFIGYQLKSVLSGSMEPGIRTGSIITVKPAENTSSYRKGDVITFLEEDNKLITHRIVEVLKNGSGVMYKTKGDNNDGPDMNPVLPQNVVAEYTGWTIPYVGYFSSFAQSKNGNVILLIIPGVLLLIYSVISIWRTISSLEEKAPPAVPAEQKEQIG